MFDKNLSPPDLLLQALALEGRLTPNHEKLPDIKEKIKSLRSGYNGEKTINYYLNQIPERKYRIFHDLRLPIGDSFFQIDALLLSKKLIHILEGKNHSGTLDIQKNQMIQEYMGIRKVYDNPISQANRQKILLRALLSDYHFPKIPIEFHVVITKPKTEVFIPIGYKEAEERVCKAIDLLRKIEEAEANYTRNCIDSKTLYNVRDFFLAKHTPLIVNILQMFEIAVSNLLIGVHCPNSCIIPMNYKRGIWICPSCHFISKDAHLKAIDDYFRLIKPFFTNSELRKFLHIPSSRETNYLTSLLNLPHTGTTRNRIYHHSPSFPLYPNHLF